MEKIFSKIEPSLLLNIVCRKKDLAKNVRFMSSENDALQVAAMRWEKGIKFQHTNTLNK